MPIELAHEVRHGRAVAGPAREIGAALEDEHAQAAFSQLLGRDAAGCTGTDDNGIVHCGVRHHLGWYWPVRGNRLDLERGRHRSCRKAFVLTFLPPGPKASTLMIIDPSLRSTGELATATAWSWSSRPSASLSTPEKRSGTPAWYRRKAVIPGSWVPGRRPLLGRRVAMPGRHDGRRLKRCRRWSWSRARCWC